MYNHVLKPTFSVRRNLSVPLVTCYRVHEHLVTSLPNLSLTPYNNNPDNNNNNNNNNNKTAKKIWVFETLTPPPPPPPPHMEESCLSARPN